MNLRGMVVRAAAGPVERAALYSSNHGPRNAASRRREPRMLSFGLAQLAGALALLWQPVLPHPGVFLLSLPLVLAASTSARTRWLAGAWLGAALAALVADQRLDERLDAALDGEVFEITGRIHGLV